MARKSLIAASVAALLVLTGATVHEAGMHHDRMAPPSAEAVSRALGPFDVDPSWIKSGSPNFRGTETARAPDGSGVTGLWACDGPSTFEWRFGSDETVHLLEGKVEVEYLGKRA